MSGSLSKSTDCSQSSDKPLSLTRTVINTRPVERAAPLTRHLQQAGLTVVGIPMLALEACASSDTDMRLMRQWLAGEYQALVIVSPTAAASGLAIWQLLERERQANSATDKEAKGTEGSSRLLAAPSHLIAVGEATAAVLNEAKLPFASYQVLQPAIANNEGMLAIPEIDSLQAGDKLLVWRGLGGRRLLVDTLQARGVHIDSIAWYERKMPINAMAQYQQWRQDFNNKNATTGITASQQAKPIVIVSSGTAFEHWESIVQTTKTINLAAENQAMSANTPLKLSDFAYVVLGERLANMVAEKQLSYWRVEDLAPETILTAINTTGL
ncbi:MAG: uroporphyrinogen-III synthase [Psychrobacter sp.]|nr:uroporphyrinogen-III synthase [Psychrobacter sp.]